MGVWTILPPSDKQKTWIGNCLFTHKIMASLIPLPRTITQLRGEKKICLEKFKNLGY